MVDKIEQINNNLGTQQEDHNMANNYNILADYIVSKYIERISGEDIAETFVDDSPADRVMVGMLAENRMEQRFDGGYAENSTTRFKVFRL